MPAQYPNNLEAIFNSSSPLAMRYAMQQQQNALASDALDQQKQTLANQFAEQTNPIKVQQEQAGLDTTLAQLPGVRADSRLKEVTADTAEATKSTDIAARISKGLANMSDDRVKQIANLGQSMLHMADLAEGGQMPPLEIQQTLPPEIVQLLGTPGGRAELRRKGQAVIQHTSDFMQKKMLSDSDNSSRERMNRDDNATALEIAKLRQAQAASKGGGTSWYEKFRAAKKPIEKHTIASTAALLLEEQANTSTDPAEKQQLMQEAQIYRKLQAEAADALEAEYATKYRPGIDPAATANTGRVVGTTPATVPRGPVKKEFKKDEQGRILLD